jgi:SAM-dependent methyltransferase
MFLDAGAREVCGIDVLDDVGVDYPRKRARYLQMSAEAMGFGDDIFDIVFCVATMEHVMRPEAAFDEIRRVTAPEGFMYVVSAPLWHSRQGHHKSDIFDVDRYPWIHLRFEAEALERMCKTGEVDYPDSVEDIAGEIAYVMGSPDFNRKPARDYVAICSELRDIVVERNDLDLEHEAVLQLLPDIDRAELIDRVGDSIELRALTHTLAAWRTQRPRATTRPRAAASAWLNGLRLRSRLRDTKARLLAPLLRFGKHDVLNS